MNKTICAPANIRHAILTALPLTMMLAACGGGGSSDGSSSSSSGSGSSGSSASSSSSGGSSSTSASIAGIYLGVNTVNGAQEQDAVLALPNGDFIGLSIEQSNGCAAIDYGSVSLTGSSFQGGLAAAFITTTIGNVNVTTGCTYTDGSPSATGSISGTLAPGASITATTNLTTAAGTALPPETLTLPLSPLYAEPGTLAKLAGAYTTAASQVLNIDATGAAQLQDAASGCLAVIQFSVVGDASHDLYTATETFSGCTGSAAVLNGQTANGIFTLDDTVSPAQLEGGATLTVGGVTYAVGSFAVRQ